MADRLFGTDGVRGKFGQEPMSLAILARLGRAAGMVLAAGGGAADKADTVGNTVLIARDTRHSGPDIEAALVVGLASVGVKVLSAGVVPTPAAALLTRTNKCAFGIMITASHNPASDNGVKFFGPDGYKLSDSQESQIESVVREADWRWNGVAEQAADLQGALQTYSDHVAGSIGGGTPLTGMKLVLDCAHGAAYQTAPQVLRMLGADVTVIGASPDGQNINAGCGSTDTSLLKRTVVTTGADLGIALDGDADRLILVDETGIEIDGDQIMALIALGQHKAGTLKGGGLVATVMSNPGLERLMDEHGLKLLRTKVGDRHVVDAMRRNGFNVGGEQSGHIVLGDVGTTGDGLLAALQVLAALKKADAPASQALKQFDPVPQLLKNTRYEGADPLSKPNVQSRIASAEVALRGVGRLVIRKSGTEPVIRVMAEGDNAALVERVVDDLIVAIGEAVE